MIGMVRDTWRAVLVLVVGVILLDRHHRPPTVGTYASIPAQREWTSPPMPYQQPQFVAHAPPSVITVAPQPDRPLLRVAESVIALGDSFLGVIR